MIFCYVSVLFNESKLPKSTAGVRAYRDGLRFSTLQRVEIAEIYPSLYTRTPVLSVSVLFNESKLPKSLMFQAEQPTRRGFSTLQRVEIAEIGGRLKKFRIKNWVSVLFNESKLPKCVLWRTSFGGLEFQYSSTSRNCRNTR